MVKTVFRPTESTCCEIAVRFKENPKVIAATFKASYSHLVHELEWVRFNNLDLTALEAWLERLHDISGDHQNRTASSLQDVRWCQHLDGIRVLIDPKRGLNDGSLRQLRAMIDYVPEVTTALQREEYGYVKSMLRRVIYSRLQPIRVRKLLKKLVALEGPDPRVCESIAKLDDAISAHTYIRGLYAAMREHQRSG